MLPSPNAAASGRHNIASSRTDFFRVALRRFLPICAAFLFCLPFSPIDRVSCEEADTLAAEEPSEPECPLEQLAQTWRDWPQSENFKITLEYRNYTYFEDEFRGDSRDSINEGRLRIEYDNCFRDNMRVYVNALLQDDDDDFTHGWVNDFEDDDVKRNHLNFPEAFLDVYFDTFDLRLGKQIVNWGKADAFNPTDNVTPTDYSNLLDEEDIGAVAASLNYYWNDWDLQLVGVPGFTPTRLPPRGTRFSLIPPESSAFVQDPELPANMVDNAQFGARLKTTYRGWDFSASYYDGINDIPSPELRRTPTFPFLTVVPVFNRFRAVGGDFATTFDKLGFHGEAAYLKFDGDTQDARIQYAVGLDYQKSDILFDHDLFIIVEYLGEEVTEEGATLETDAPPLDRIFMSAVAVKLTYEFTEYTRIEMRGAVDFHQGEDYYAQPQLVHDMTDNFQVALGFDVIGGPRDTFLGQFTGNDRVYLKLKYAF